GTTGTTLAQRTVLPPDLDDLPLLLELPNRLESMGAAAHGSTGFDGVGTREPACRADELHDVRLDLLEPRWGARAHCLLLAPVINHADARGGVIADGDVLDPQVKVLNRGPLRLSGRFHLPDQARLTPLTGDHEHAAAGVEDGRRAAQNHAGVAVIVLWLASMVIDREGCAGLLADAHQHVEARTHLRIVLVFAWRGAAKRVEEDEAAPLADARVGVYSVWGIEVYAG